MGVFTLLGKTTDAIETMINSAIGLTESVDNVVKATNRATKALDVAANGLLQDQIFSAEKAEQIREDKRLEWRKSLDLVADEPL